MGATFTHHTCQLQRNNGVTKNSASSFYEQILPQIWLPCSSLLLTESFLTPFPRPQQTNSLVILSKEALCPMYFYSPRRDALLISAPHCHTQVIQVFLYGVHRSHSVTLVPSSKFSTSFPILCPAYSVASSSKEWLFSLFVLTVTFRNANNPCW